MIMMMMILPLLTFYDGAVDLEDTANEKQPRGPRHRVTSRPPLCVRIPYSHASHCEELDGSFNASVKKNYSLGLYYNLDLRERYQQEVGEICMLKSSTISTPHQTSLHTVQ